MEINCENLEDMNTKPPGSGERIMSAHIAQVDVYKSPESVDFELGTARGREQVLSHLNSECNGDNLSNIIEVESKSSIKPDMNYTPDKETDEPKKESACRQYMLMFWDGLGFFGTSDTKLPRLEGKKVTFCTPF